ncbi:MAG: hypothetical protein ACO1OB_13470 [Archangium sp.]
MRSLLSGLVLGMSLSLLGCDPGNGGEGGTGGGSGGNNGTQNAALEGRVSDESGVSGSADDTGSSLTGFAGRGTVAATANIQVVAVEDDGNLTVLATGAVSADGSYSINIPNSDRVLIVQSLDAQGEVLGRALVSRNPTSTVRRQVQPITSESTLEAWVLLELAAQGHAPRDVDVSMLRLYVEERAAIVVRSQGNVEAAKVQVRAMAYAVWAAQTSAREAFTRAGADINARVQAQLDAYAAYDSNLYARTMTELDAEADLRAQLDAANLRGDVDASVVASIEANATASARRVLADASLQANVALVAAWQHACAMHEASLNAAVMVQVMTRATVDEAQMMGLRTLNASLYAAVRVANDDAAIAAAFSTWRTGVRGVASGASSSMGLMSVVTQIQVALLAQVVTNGSELGAGLNAKLVAAMNAHRNSGSFDFAALAGATADIDSEFRTQLDAMVRATITGLDERDGSLLVSTLITTEGAWR